MIRRILAVLVPVALLVACAPAGSGNESPGGGGNESTGPGASQAAASAAASTGGGGGAAIACDLITTGEVATVMGVASTEAESVPGEPSYCSYRSDGQLVAATSFSTETAETVWAAYGNDGPAVSGLGDKAVFSNSTGTLFFVKGDAIMGITAGPGSMAADERQALAEQLGAFAAGRL